MTCSFCFCEVRFCLRFHTYLHFQNNLTWSQVTVIDEFLEHKFCPRTLPDRSITCQNTWSDIWKYKEVFLLSFFSYWPLNCVTLVSSGWFCFSQICGHFILLFQALGIKLLGKANIFYNRHLLSLFYACYIFPSCLSPSWNIWDDYPPCILFTHNSLLCTVIWQIEKNKSELIIISSLLSVFLLLLTWFLFTWK